MTTSEGLGSPPHGLSGFDLVHQHRQRQRTVAAETLVEALVAEKIGVVRGLASGGDQARVPHVGNEGQVQRLEDLVRNQRSADGVGSPVFEDLLPEPGKPLALVGTQGTRDFQLRLLFVALPRGLAFSVGERHPRDSRNCAAFERIASNPSGMEASDRRRSVALPWSDTQSFSRG